MSQQLETLRQELARLAETLDASDALSEEQRVQISDLGQRMNRALAGKVQELQRYRSEFFWSPARHTWHAPWHSSGR